MTEPLITLAIYCVLIGLIFLVIRSIVLWYWKVDRIVALLERQNVLLEALANGTKPSAVPRPMTLREEHEAELCT